MNPQVALGFGREGALWTPPQLIMSKFILTAKKGCLTICLILIFLLLSLNVGYSPYFVSQVILALVPSKRYPHSVDLSHHETADPALLPVNN